MPRHEINYPAIMSTLADKTEAEVKTALADQLPDLWCESYAEMSGGPVEIVEITLDSYRFLFDLARERVVVAYGLSAPNPEARRRQPHAGLARQDQRPLPRTRRQGPHHEPPPGRRAGHQPLPASGRT